MRKASPLPILPPQPAAKPLFGLNRAQLQALVADWGQPAFRANQLAEALYRQRVESIAEVSTLSKSLREQIESAGYAVARPSIAQVFSSVDGTERYLVETNDGRTVETVWMPEGDDGESGDGSEDSPVASADPKETVQRATICVSSQIGCAVNCQFCLTAKLGFERNLTPGEIAGQVIAVLNRHQVEVGRDRVNLVFMGMGEPFLNYDNFMAAVRILVEEVGLSPQRMTVSTSGIVPGIEQFAAEPPALRPKLALSLNAPDDAVRAEVMPINRKWPLDQVVAALRTVRLRPRERLTFEYVLLGDVTDQPDHARQVARFIRRTGLPVKVNLIVWNPGPDVPYKMPESGAPERFHALLIAEGVPAYLRRPRGRDIYAACGQLKRTVEG
ncbi:23S rRNA (adenine(2503)-C(2))-methyltransferase RlmN [Telmatobacter bradus]|uniref:23S rRNA (adenine(2503)-C(2))-methyltransferase RlmN n=1 Tax=Telmatobacter bradus TaxID=474953 RepID=UPI003B436AB4